MAGNDRNQLLETILATIPPLHPDGWKFVAMFALATMLLFFLWCPLGWAGLILTAWCAFFFRDPARVTPLGADPANNNLVIAPADGKIMPVVQAAPPAELMMGGAPLTRISIFLNVFDVHVNRVPADGAVKALHYHKGAFINAALDKASEDNERQLCMVETADGKKIGFVQIAGFVARRIVCRLAEGQRVKAGERFGLIRFGSRVDVYLPPGAAPLVVAGQYAVGGETVLADLRGGDVARTGEVR